METLKADRYQILLEELINQHGPAHLSNLSSSADDSEASEQPGWGTRTLLKELVFHETFKKHPAAGDDLSHRIVYD